MAQETLRIPIQLYVATMCDCVTFCSDVESPTRTDGLLTGGVATQKCLKSARLDQARTTMASDGDPAAWQVRIEDRESFSGEEVTGLSRGARSPSEFLLCQRHVERPVHYIRGPHSYFKVRKTRLRD